MVTIRPEIPADVTAREALLDRAFGRARHRKTSQRFRDDRLPADQFDERRTRCVGVRLMALRRVDAEEADLQFAATMVADVKRVAAELREGPLRERGLGIEQSFDASLFIISR